MHQGVLEPVERYIHFCAHHRQSQANANPARQNLFPIIQGGLNPGLREICVKGIIAAARVKLDLNARSAV